MKSRSRRSPRRSGVAGHRGRRRCGRAAPAQRRAARLCRRRHLGADRRAGRRRALSDIQLAERAGGLCHRRRRGRAAARDRECRGLRRRRREAHRGDFGVGPNDVVIGVAASGETPFTVAALKTARERGALTIGVASNRGSQLLQVSEHPILIETGAEPVAGSTRLKAGTAQKVVLNLFSTMVMVRLGRVYRGLMVHMRPTNEKLRRRVGADGGHLDRLRR